MNNAQEQGVQITPSETSLFSSPQENLDPRLFRNGKIISSVRDGVLSALYGHLNLLFADAESWTTVWLAGSGVSYQWAAQRTPADLDCLIGVDYVTLRRANTNFAKFSDREIAAMLNEGFRQLLHPQTANFLGEFELTFYVNVISDITKIKPYAAYSLTADDWTVAPSNTVETFPPNYFEKANKDVRMAQDIISRYQQALNDMSVARNETVHLNAQTMAKLAAQQGSHLFEEIHSGRGAAFTPSGGGYTDFANFRWQYGKSQGVVQALKKLHDIVKEERRAAERALYGAELPDAATLIRRAASQYRG